MYSLLLALIYIAFISLGLPDPLIGASWPVMHEALGVSVAAMGTVTMVIAAGTVISSLFSDLLTRRLGAGVVTVVSVFLTAAALFGFSFSTELWMIILFAVPYGLGAGAIDAALNNYVSLHYSARHMSWLHCFWGVGTIISPFVMSFALTGSSWNNGYRAVGLIQLLIALLLLLTLPLWRINKKVEADLPKPRGVGIAGAIRIRGVGALLIGFFAYSAAEVTAISWSATYLSEVRGMGGELAAACASAVFIGMTVGRFIGGFVTERLGDRRMILLGAAFFAVGALFLFIPSESAVLAVAGFSIIGFGFAPTYPCIIHSAKDCFGAENSGAIIGIQMASAYVGTTFMPPLYGLLGKIFGYGIMPIYLVLFMALSVFMCEWTFRVAKRA